MALRTINIALLVLTLATANIANAVELAGMLAFDSRAFLDNPAFPEQRRDTYYPSLLIQPEFRQQWQGEKDRFNLTPFFRLEPSDPQRQHWDIRELNWMHTGDAWDLTVGAAKVFWGVTESRHLVDIINQSDLIEDINQKQKLGQPMINLNLIRDYGTFSFFVLPYFRPITYENPKGRLRFQLPIDTRHRHYQSSLDVWHPDLSARWGHHLGDWDIGLAHFWGTSRESSFDLNLENPFTPTLVPHYELINQSSADIQYTSGAWLLKLEAITRSGQGKRFAAVTTGFEYTFYDLMKTGSDLGLITEYNYDGRDKTPTVAPPVPYDNDLFVGARLSLNDAQSSSVLAGVLQDLNGGATFVSFEASRRFSNTWTAEVKGRFIMSPAISDFVFYGYRQDSYFQLCLARYF